MRTFLPVLTSMLLSAPLVWAGSSLSSHLAVRGGDEPKENPMEALMKNAGLDSSQLDDLMKSMPGGEGGMPSMEESMSMMQEMINSPLFDEYLNDPEKLEQSRQMIVSNPMMKGMMAGMPGMDEILNDPVKWRETMIAAGNMYKNMGGDLMKAMQGDDSFDLGGAPAALDELSEGED